VSRSANLRLFVAASVPQRELQRVARAIAPLTKTWAGGRWIPVDNQHVTLKFLGSTPPDLLEPVTSAASVVAARHRPVRLRLTELGSFPSSRRMRVLWVGLDDPEGRLAAMAADLDDALEPLGFTPEKRSFTPHLTLARFKSPVRLKEALPELESPARTFDLQALELFRSHLHPTGARYELLGEIPLGGGDFRPAPVRTPSAGQ
jgi:2'-5' RNA ligase